jgi:Protein of unknown function (DUF742)
VTDDPRHGGRVVPVYAVTGGRTRAGDHDLPIEAVVTASAADNGIILDLAHKPVGLVEVAAGLGVPIGVARVLVSDLAEAGHIAVHTPEYTDGPPPQVLARLLDGLRAR